MTKYCAPALLFILLNMGCPDQQDYFQFALSLTSILQDNQLFDATP